MCVAAELDVGREKLNESALNRERIVEMQCEQVEVVPSA